MREWVWIFDLDNTLHDATLHIFPHINRSMTAYLCQHLQLDEVAANALREEYWRCYGATLTGLMKHHGTDPEHFLWHTHQFPELKRMVLREPRLRRALQQLPGRKVLYSNAPLHYAQAVLKVLRVADLFDQVYTIEQAHYRPKPQRAGLRGLLHKLHWPAARCVMVEDSADNLRTAKRFGMRTVWVSDAPRVPHYVDVQVTDVLALPRIAARL